MSPRSWLGGILAIVAVQVALLFLYQRVERDRAGGDVPISLERRSEPANDIVVERPDGSILTLPARSDRYRLVHFWATWCPPCVKEIPSLLRLARRDPSRLRVWAVSADMRWEDVRGFFGGEVPDHVTRDPTGDAARAYSVRQLPDTYLVDPRGQVIARFATRQEWDAEEMRVTLRQLTAGNGSAQ